MNMRPVNTSSSPTRTSRTSRSRPSGPSRSSSSPRRERDDAAVRFVKSAYYLEPDKVGRKAFHLLKSVLEDDGLTAICKIVIKDREALAALDPLGDTMLLTTLHWPDEIRSVDELDLGDEKYDFKPAELAMARQLVSAMTGEFDPAQYKDEYRQALETIIEAKVEGKETVAVEAPEETSNLIDLMAALEASVNAAKAARDSNADKPVSVSEAKEAKAAKAATAEKGTSKAARQGRLKKTRRPPNRPGSARPPDPSPAPGAAPRNHASRARFARDSLRQMHAPSPAPRRIAPDACRRHAGVLRHPSA